MQRFLRLRDFDWVLMALVFLLSALSVLEIYSATINTKFHGFENKQVLWLVGGTAAMLLLSLHRLPRAAGRRSIGSTGSASSRCWWCWWRGRRCWGRGDGSAVGRDSLSALGVGEADPDHRGGALLHQHGGQGPDWKDIGKAFLLVGVPMALVLKQPDLGTALTYMPVLLIGLFLGGIGWKKALIIVCAGLVLIVPVWRQG